MADLIPAPYYNRRYETYCWTFSNFFRRVERFSKPHSSVSFVRLFAPFKAELLEVFDFWKIYDVVLPYTLRDLTYSVLGTGTTKDSCANVIMIAAAVPKLVAEKMTASPHRPPAMFPDYGSVDL